MSNLFYRIKNVRRIEYILLSIILISAFLTRLYKLNNPIADWHSFRQADTSSVSRIYVSKGINLLLPRYHDISTTQSGKFNPEGFRFVEFPIYNALQAYLFKAFPFLSLEVWGRLISILSALISTYFLFLLGRKFIGSWGGVLAAFFFALIPFNIYFTRVIMPEPLAEALGLASMWAFIRFIDEERSKMLALSVILFAAALLTKPFVMFYGIPMAFLAIKKYGIRGSLYNRQLLLAVIIAFVPVVLWRAWMGQFPEGIPFWRWIFNGDGIRFKPSFWRWIFGERLGHLILGGWGLILFSFGLLKPKRGNYFNHFFLLGMFLYLVVFATANVRHDYYQTITIPAISLTLAQGSIYMWETKEFKRRLTRGLLAFSLMVMFLTGALQVREFYKINRPEIIEVGKAVQRLVPENSLVIAPYNGDTALLYQTDRRGWPVVDRPIDELIDKGANYFVSVDLGHPQTIEFSQRFEIVEERPQYIILNLNKERSE